MRIVTVITGLLTLILACWSATAAPNKFTNKFPLEDCEFSPSGGNAYFMLKPGRQLYFSNQQCFNAGDCDELEEVWITVTSRTRDISLNIDGTKRVINTRVVEERETADGELSEISRNYFAVCKPMRDVYYFGERVDIYEGGKIVGHEGQWLAGRDRARPGMIMPDQAFLLGARYYQEIAPEVALDRAEHVELDMEVTVPAGTFDDCVRVTETSPLDPGQESTKIYCAGVGLVIDDELELAAVYE